MKGNKNSELTANQSAISVFKDLPKEVESKRVKLLEGLASAHINTLKTIEQQMAGKTGAELAMLKNAASAVKASMGNYRDLIDIERQKDLEMKQSKEKETTLENNKGQAVVNIEAVVQKLAIKIEIAYKGLGFECETSVQKDGKNNFSIKAEPKMPEEFKGKDPFKLSLEELNQAKEALVNEKSGVSRSVGEKSKSAGTKSVVIEQEKEKPAVSHQDLGDFTHQIMEKEKKERLRNQGGNNHGRELGA